MSLDQELIAILSEAAGEDLAEYPGDRQVDRVLGPTDLIQGFEEIEVRYGIQIDRSDSRLHGGFGDLIRNLKSQIESKPPVQQAELEKPPKGSAKRTSTPLERSEKTSGGPKKGEILGYTLGGTCLGAGVVFAVFAALLLALLLALLVFVLEWLGVAVEWLFKALDRLNDR